MHNEIDYSDVGKGKNDDMMLDFNCHSFMIDGKKIGTPISIGPMFTPFLDNEMKLKCSKHIKNQGIQAQVSSLLPLMDPMLTPRFTLPITQRYKPLKQQILLAINTSDI